MEKLITFFVVQYKLKKQGSHYCGKAIFLGTVAIIYIKLKSIKYTSTKSSGHITESKEIGYEHCYERLRASWSDFIYWEFYCDYDSKYNRGYAFDTDNEPYFVVGWSVRGEAR
jgi:hypothetical protein